MLIQNKVGKQLYVWSQREGGMSPDTPECIISAHGGIPIINGTFDSNVTLIYYCPHGQSLTDNDLIPDIILGTIRHEPPVTGQACQDYVLSKYQGRHSGGFETYDTVRNKPLQALQHATGYNNTALEKMNKGVREGNKDEFERGFNLAEKLETYRWKDIVTIRNRVGKMDPMLSEVITELRGAGYTYTTFHCSFCRCSMMPWKSPHEVTPGPSY